MMVAVGPLSVPVTISQKLSKIDPSLLRNTITKLALLILLSHSHPADTALRRNSGFKCKLCANITTASCLVMDHSCCKPSMTIVSSLVIVNCYKRRQRWEPVVYDHRLLS